MPQSPDEKPLRLGTRGSKLAAAQATMVRGLLQMAGNACDLVIVKTSGDRIQDRSLADAGGKGLFTKELEDALLDGRVDLAVHSMKDVPVDLPAGLALAALLPRADPRDAFLSHKAAVLADLPEGARMGTSSVRRRAQLLRARPDLKIGLLRGNVDTRLGQLDSGAFDAILLAYAGLKRLELGARATSLLAPEDWLPALAQGAVGIEIREDDANARAAVAALDDPATSVVLACERAFQAALDGSCRTPIAGLAQYADGVLKFRGEVLSPDGRDFVETGFETALRTDALRHAAERGREAGLAIKPRAAAWLAL
jgi:hydroxymethylbilane synthase